MLSCLERAGVVSFGQTSWTPPTSDILLFPNGIKTAFRRFPAVQRAKLSDIKLHGKAVFLLDKKPVCLDPLALISLRCPSKSRAVASA